MQPRRHVGTVITNLNHILEDTILQYLPATGHTSATPIAMLYSVAQDLFIVDGTTDSSSTSCHSRAPASRC